MGVEFKENKTMKQLAIESIASRIDEYDSVEDMMKAVDNIVSLKCYSKVKDLEVIEKS